MRLKSLFKINFLKIKNYAKLIGKGKNIMTVKLCICNATYQKIKSKMSPRATMRNDVLFLLKRHTHSRHNINTHIIRKITLPIQVIAVRDIQQIINFRESA